MVRENKEADIESHALQKQGSCIKLLILQCLWSCNSKRQTEIEKTAATMPVSPFPTTWKQYEIWKQYELPLKHSRDLKHNSRTAALENIS